jgi:penicillin amidase
MGINIKLLQVLVTIQLERKLSVKDTTDVVLNVKVSRHGPVMNGLITGLDNNEPVAMSWIYTTTHSYSRCGLHSSHAKNKADFQKVALISAPIKRDVW